MVIFCKPEESKNIHNMMVAIEEELWQNLKIPYRKVNICS
jgi:seryl-tRNA synthetase